MSTDASVHQWLMSCRRGGAARTRRTCELAIPWFSHLHRECGRERNI